MCLAVPMKIESVEEGVAVTSYAGGEYKVRVDLVDADVGDYVLVHAGIAVAIVDENEALETLKLFKEIDDINQSLSRPGRDESPGRGDPA